MELLEYLKDISLQNSQDDYIKVPSIYLEELIECVEKQNPSEPLLRDDLYVCPRCKSYVGGIYGQRRKICTCGQKLKFK